MYRLVFRFGRTCCAAGKTNELCRQLQAPKHLRLMDKQFRCIFPTHWTHSATTTTTITMRNGNRNQIKQNRSRCRKRGTRTANKKQAKFDVTSSANEAKLMQPGVEKLQLAAASITHTHRHANTPSLSLTYTTTRVFSTFTHSLILSLWGSGALCRRPGKLHEKFWLVNDKNNTKKRTVYASRLRFVCRCC